MAFCCLKTQKKKVRRPNLAKVERDSTSTLSETVEESREKYMYTKQKQEGSNIKTVDVISYEDSEKSVKLEDLLNLTTEQRKKLIRDGTLEDSDMMMYMRE